MRPPWFAKVNAAFRVDRRWGPTGKSSIVANGDWSQENVSYSVHTQSHIQNCVTRYGCIWDFYPNFFTIDDPFGQIVGRGWT